MTGRHANAFNDYSNTELMLNNLTTTEIEENAQKIKEFTNTLKKKYSLK